MPNPSHTLALKYQRCHHRREGVRPSSATISGRYSQGYPRSSSGATVLANFSVDTLRMSTSPTVVTATVGTLSSMATKLAETLIDRLSLPRTPRVHAASSVAFAVKLGWAVCPDVSTNTTDVLAASAYLKWESGVRTP